MAAVQPRTPAWARELLGVTTAVAIAVAIVAFTASTPRAALLLDDGDSLVTTLVIRSIAAGQPQDWAMSSVLFVPETSVLALLTSLGLGVDGTLLLAGVVNMVGLYGALRVASGARGRAGAPVAGALLGLAAFAALAATETSPDRDAFEPASLLLTTTYYSATVIGAVVAVGLARRGLESGRRSHVWLLAAVAAASVATNPLFAAWAAVPLGAVLALVAVRAATAGPVRGIAVRLGVALVAGSVAGFLVRIPLAPLIANSGAGYADPSRALESLGYYAALAAERMSHPSGAVAAVAGVGLWVWCLTAAVRLRRRRRRGPALVATFGWLAPLVVAIGAVVLGTEATRYLQPIAFAPVLGLVVVPDLMPRSRRSRIAVPVLAVASTAALVAAAVLAGPRLVTSATTPDADLDCVVEWTDASARTGAGQFWTIRLPKAHVADPGSLVQVDHELRGYAWLVNRADFAVGEVSFLVVDAQTAAFALPDGRAMTDAAAVVPCGRYTIVDFGDRPLPIGPLRS
ncbi:hypothetical protein ACFUTX_09935 [Microbacterium sp. NPDC057407]|uniref:hypothetical protein n=1 Tax=Microbacterium sp. NPDC057407 TaxID=3346120 RepID=UPI003671AA51